jgi:hypothetical protein
MRYIRLILLFTLAASLPQVSHASLLAKFFSYVRHKAETPPNIKEKQAGQETRAFKMTKANAHDLEPVIQHYLDGVIKTGGAVQVRESDNALVVTAFPDNLETLAYLLPDVDHPYENSNAMARQMLATQSLMKAIRTHGGLAVASTRNVERAAPVRGVTATGPASGTVFTVKTSHVPSRRSRDEDDMKPNPKRRVVNSPSLGTFEVVGWMKDDDGYFVVLKNEDRRFVFRRGKLHGGYDPRSEAIAGVRGAIHDNRLILTDPRGQISLKILKWHDL